MIKELIRNTQDTQLMIDLAVAQETQKLVSLHDNEIRSKNDRIIELERLLSDEKEITSKLKTDLDMKLSLINKHRQTIQEQQQLITDLTEKLSLIMKQREQERAIAQATIQQATQPLNTNSSAVPVSSSSEFEQPNKTTQNPNNAYSYYNSNNSNNKVVPRKNTVVEKKAVVENKTLLNNGMGDRESTNSSQLFANTTIVTPNSMVREGLTPLPVDVSEKTGLIAKHEQVMITATELMEN